MLIVYTVFVDITGPAVNRHPPPSSAFSVPSAPSPSPVTNAQKEKIIDRSSTNISPTSSETEARKALKYYEELLAANVIPDSVTIEGVLLALSQASLHVKSMELIRDAATIGVVPTKYMYRIVLGFIFKNKAQPDFDALKALCSDKLTEAAAVFLVEEAFRMRRLTIRTAEPIIDLFLRDADDLFSANSFLLVISLCKQVNALYKSLRVLKAMVRGEKATTLAFNMVLKICEKNREAKKALNLLKEMQEAGLEPDIITYNTLISACAKGNLPQECKRLLKGMEEKGIQPNLVSLNSVIDGLAHSGRWLEAMDIMNIINRRGLKPDVFTYTGLIQACSKGGQASKALSFLESMTLAGVKPDAVAYSAAIEACARAGWGKKASDLYADYQAAGFQPHPQIIRALVAACGEEMGVDRVWSMIQECPPELRNNYIYSSAIKSCNRDWKMALRLLNDMRSIGISPDDITFGQTLHVLSSAGRWEEAFEVLDSIKNRNVRHYTSVLRACSPHAPHQGLVVYEQMRRDGIEPDLHAYNVLLQALRSSPSDTSEDALAIYEEMRKAGSGISPDIITFTVIIAILERAGRHEDALTCFSDGVELGILMNTSLDSLWERDLSRLSYQLIRAAVDYSLREVVKHYNNNHHGERKHKSPPSSATTSSFLDEEGNKEDLGGIEDLILITGIDSSKGGGSKGTRYFRRPKFGEDNKTDTRQGLACVVLKEKGSSEGVGGCLSPTMNPNDPGILKVKAAALRTWLERGAPE